jgi:hypothetical protein
MTEFAKGLMRVARCFVTLIEAGYQHHQVEFKFGGEL